MIYPVRTTPMPKRHLTFISLLILLSASWACSRHQPAAGAVSTQMVKDDLGRQVMIARRPERVISLAPNITEMLFALGSGDQVVGVTTYCNYPPEAQSKIKMGDTVHPSLERILSLKPDLIIASRVSQLEVFAHQLEEFGIPLYVVDARSIDDVPRSLRKLGSLLGRPDQADSVARTLEQRIKQMGPPSQGTAPPRVLLVIQREPLMVPGTQSYLADLVRKAGGTLIGPDDAREGVTYSLESVIAQHPEIIVLPGESGMRTRRLDHFVWPKLAQTPAIQEGKVYSIDADLVMRPGPRLVDGLYELARILHPEVVQR
jgi:iron complex transport system substrate-binding protein